MELKEIFLIFKKEKTIILGTTLAVIILSLFFYLAKPPNFVVYLDIETKRVNRPKTSDYQYDEYYALSATNLVTDAINSWFQSRAFSEKILREADFEEKELTSLRNFVKTRKLSSQTLEIKITGPSSETLENLAKIIQKEVEIRLSGLNTDREGNPAFRADIEVSSAQPLTFHPAYLTLAALGSGLLLGIFLAFVHHYLKEQPRSM